MKKTQILLMAMVGISTMAFSDKEQATWQPESERKAQENLPMARDGVWAKLAKVKITYSDKEPHISARITPEVKALNGSQLSVSGFVMPMDAGEKTRHFLLSKRTPTCPFCPPGEPNEVVEVFTNKPVPWDENLLVIKGKFTLKNDTEQGVFFVLKDGEVIRPPAGAMLKNAVDLNSM